MCKVCGCEDLLPFNPHGDDDEDEYDDDEDDEE